MIASGRVPVFSCGTQFIDWQDRNCCRCQHPNWESFEAHCDLLAALCAAAWDDGTIAAEIAHRIGCDDPLAHYTWDCPERVPESDARAEGPRERLA